MVKSDFFIIMTIPERFSLRFSDSKCYVGVYCEEMDLMAHILMMGQKSNLQMVRII